MSYCDLCETDHYDKCPWDTVKKTQDELDSTKQYTKHLEKQCNAYVSQINELRDAIIDLLTLPYVIDEATVPLAGVEANSSQVVGTLHMSLARRRQLMRITGYKDD